MPKKHEGARAPRVDSSTDPRVDSRVDSRVDPRAEAEALFAELQRGEWPAIEGFVLEGCRFILARKRARPSKSVTLTAREREILALVAEGHTNRSIASLLAIATSTASVHLARAMQKLGARSRVALTLAAQSAGARP